MSWAYLGLDSLFNTAYNAIVSLYQAFIANISRIDPRYLLTAGGSSTDVSTVVQNPSSTNIVSQVINFGVEKVSSLLGAIASVPMGLFNLVRGESEGIRLVGAGDYPLATIPQESASTVGTLIENHPYLLAGCALAVAGGAVYYNYSGSNKERSTIYQEPSIYQSPTMKQEPTIYQIPTMKQEPTMEAELSVPKTKKPWMRIRKSEEAELMRDAQRFLRRY